ncbi:hypothetical protein KDU71_07350 [Carboxylicivirga sediminis]|uniref:TolB protein n=1 Tax=Carboxylicivirga sediminis TaxID=2006564 RepID=A0A941F252_9BACT|nr:hypothetical protein [Carboxylicivirga sediminis]MBR8535371.1 hypothetical protein [Carboxylicivirga sediminis]
MRHIFSFLILLLFATNIKAQYYSSGADPANVKWRQLRSESFRVVYPEEFEQEAKRFIAIMDSLYTYGGYTLDHTPKPIDVLIHSRSAYSNGFVSWAPKRIEIYSTPHQDMIAQDWLTQLAIHEFRHVVQIDKLNKGFTKALTIPFGQQAIGAVLGLYAPLWFLEGDATLTETTLSQSGRGRRPSFEQELRAQLLEKEIYHYDKAYFGSYKNYVPNHYNMGYLLTAGARHKYGADVWERALDEAGRKSWSVTPFNRGIKSVTGKHKVPLYDEVFSDWQYNWQQQFDSINYSPVRYISKRDTRYKNYRYPTPIGSMHLLAEINGPGELNHFAKINIETGEEEKLLITGNREREPFSYANGVLAWTELEQHPRWNNQYFTVIRTLDLSTNKQTKITSQSRYKAPALSPDASIIAVVHTSYSNEYSLHLLETKTGNIIREIKIPDNAYPLTPDWNETGDQLVMAMINPSGKKLTILSLENEQWTDITQPAYTEIRFPKWKGQHIYFSGSYNGIENIYRIGINGENLEKLTESKFGAAYATMDSDNNIYFQDYTSDGYLIASAPLKQLQPSSEIAQQLPVEPYINKLQKDEKGMPQLDSLNTNEYASKKYSKWNLFNFHSWAPLYMNVNDAELSTGASILSQNLLGTTLTSFGYNADKLFSREKFRFNLSYQEWWPVFELDIRLGNEAIEGMYLNDIEYYINSFDAKPNHSLIDLEMKLPLNFTRGKYLRRVEPSLGMSYQYSADFNYTRYYLELDDNGEPVIEDGKYVVDYTEQRNYLGIDIKSVDYSLFAYNLLRTTQRDVATRWGQVIELNYRHTPMDGWNYGSILGLHTRLYFPGIGRHHAIRIDNGWQKKTKGDTNGQMGNYNSYRLYSDYLNFPRGVDRFYNDELYSFKGDYMMPVLNPDFNIPGVLYLKRITTNLFYDYAQATQHLQLTETNQWITQTASVSSFGTEIRGELHPFRFVFPITVGYRYARLPDTSNNHHEFLLSMGLSGLVVGKQANR